MIGRQHDDLDVIKALLTERLEEAAEAVIGQPSAETRHKQDWKFPGHGGAFLVVRGPKRGAFYSFANSSGGSPLDLVMYGRSCGFAGAVSWAREFLGLANHTGPLVVDETARAVRLRKRAEAQRQAEAEKATKDESGAAYARRVVARTTEIPGTPAERYLIETRHIPIPAGGWPHDAVRYDPERRALVMVARDASGTVRAIQRVHLTPDGRKIDAAEVAARELPDVKVTNGPPKGAAVHLPGLPGPLLLAEGPETGLSLWAATGREVWIALGSLGNVTPPQERRLVACADDDKRHSPGARALDRATDQWRSQSFAVAVATPWPERRQDGSDFNDALKVDGAAAVVARVEQAIGGRVVRPGSVPLEQARQATQAAVAGFFEAARLFDPEGGEGLPPVHAIKVGVGIGKSAAARAEMALEVVRMRREAAARISKSKPKTIVMAVPTHALGREQVEAFHALPAVRAAGLRAAMYQGRTRPDPDAPGETMCRNMAAVHDAFGAGLPVQESCCRRVVKGRNGEPDTVHQCPFFDVCGYQAQARKRPDVLFMAHEIIFTSRPKMAGNAVALVVDEAAWKTGLVGVGEKKPKTLSLDSLGGAVTLRGMNETKAIREIYGRVLAALRDQPDGPLSRAAMIAAGLTAEIVHEGELLTWDRKVDPKLRPGMPDAERKAALLEAANNATVTRVASLFRALRALLAVDGPARSGWINLLTEHTDAGAVRTVLLRGRKDVAKGWSIPTLLLDAILNADLVRPYWPQVQVTAEIEADAPHARIRQLVGHDVSARSVMLPGKPMADAPELPDDRRDKADKEAARLARNRREWLAVALREARVHGGKSCLAVGQKGLVEAWRKIGAIPSYVDLAHFNNLAGRDEWGPGPGREGVAALVSIGRTLPPAGTVERMAEALTGAAVSVSVRDYERVPGTIHMRDGTTTTTEAIRHPDPIAEAIRWQICEGELVQTAGRPRPASRTSANPVEMLFATNLPLPFLVDAVVTQASLTPSPADLMLALGGMALESPTDAARAYPVLWATPEAARKAIGRTTGGHPPLSIYLKGECPPVVPIRYQKAGERQRPTMAYADLAALPDPQARLQERLGPLAACDAFETSPDARPVSSVNVGSGSVFRPAGPWTGAVKNQPLAITLRLPLPGEDLQQHRPPLAQTGHWTRAGQPLPLSADGTVPRDAPVSSPADVMLALEGIALANPTDAAQAFPQLGLSPEAMKKALQREKCQLSAFEEAFAAQCPQPRTLATISYQRRGAGMWPASGTVDLTRKPDPRAWLEKKFGPLAWFEIDPPLVDLPAKAPKAFRPACPLDLLHPLRPGAGPDCVLVDSEDGDFLVRLDGTPFACEPDEVDLQGLLALPRVDRVAPRHDPNTPRWPQTWP